MSAESIINISSPCKINRFLHITGQRADGYHCLQTVFQLLDLHDEMIFEPADNTITLHDDSGINPEEHLVLRAAHALKAHALQSSKLQRYPLGHDAGKLGAVIRLKKNIPIGGGLGGGSSNAASTLLALNKLWGLHYSLAELAVLGIKLGADVPVFVYGNTAWAEGIGEKLTPVDLPREWVVVVKPDVFVSTAEIFSNHLLTRNTKKTTIASFLKERHSDFFKNDCEPLVRAHYPLIDDALNRLSELSGKKACLTGTGACVFLACDSQREAQSVVSQLPEDWQAFVCQSMNKSTVHQVLQY